jgi:hypothetical protein
MSSKENLSLDEFATAPRKRAADRIAYMTDAEAADEHVVRASPTEQPNENARRLEARKALRQVKRERVKGERHFVNVSLDRKTKRRLKLASFNAETSMQAIMEQAIVKHLDELGL